MAFFRFSRDKKGYEHYYLVEPSTNRRGKVTPRVLYWFRTPPGILVGRQPFDEGVRRALEAQYPAVSFDWRSIVDAPIPSADADKWRERRRAERAAKAMARADADDIEENGGDALDGEPVADDPPDANADQLEGVIASEPAVVASSDSAAVAADPARKPRRRRRGRRPGAPTGAPEAAESDEVARLNGARSGETDSRSSVKGARSGEGTDADPSGD